MMKYASDLPDFADLLRAAADWKQQRNAIVEKDCYLTRALHSLFCPQQPRSSSERISNGW